MTEMQEDKAREEHIEMEIVVDAYDEEERAMGWYCYLDDEMGFPFRTRCIAARRTSPLAAGEEVRVIGMAPEEDCMSEIFVLVEWQGRDLGVPLSQLEPIEASDETRTAVEDWHYWVARGYRF